VSDATLRRVLHRLDHAWKRPRYVLRAALTPFTIDALRGDPGAATGA
jgi:hypothetical protein